MRITATQNLVNAIENQDGISDRNLPIYINDYTVRVSTQYKSKAEILWSTVAFLPSYREFQRILNIHVAISLKETLNGISNTVENLSFVFDFSAFEEFLKDRFFITIEGPLEGNISFEWDATSFNAYRYMDYLYRELTQELTLILNDFVIPPSTTYPQTIYLNITIRDDVDDPAVYPTLFPVLVADNILRMPEDTGNRGQNVTVVMFLICCCPDELKTLQISTIDINSPDAFNPTEEIHYLLSRQGIPLPQDGVSFEFVPANDFPSVEDDPLPWKESMLMTHMNFELQNLYSSVPNCHVIILYDFLPIPTFPAYMTWLKNNTNRYDIVALSQSGNNFTNWNEIQFEEAQEFYEDVLFRLHLEKKPIVICSFNEGTNERITFPFYAYNFIVANPFTVTSGGFALSPNQNGEYNINGPYKASSYSNGGYCNRVQRPSEQFDFVYSPQYGSPDMAGYYGAYWFCQDVGSLTNSYGSSWTPQPLAALFAKIYVNTQKKDWNFKFILERKGITLCDYITRGVNHGTGNDDQYFCAEFFYWNPVIGMGNLWYEAFYKMCDVIRNNTFIQVSNLGLNNQLSFLNIMPQNTFNDFIFRQPVFGFSSIFSFFQLYVASGSGSPSPEKNPILTGQAVYLVDLSGRYALSYAQDETNHLYILLQDFNYGTTFQQWRVRDPLNPSVIRPIFAFDEIILSPFEFPNVNMTSLWNANGSTRPCSPSIRVSGVGVSETFMFNTDPTIESSLADIISTISNDTIVYSYYVNFTHLLPNDELLFLSNPNFLSINPPLDDPDALYIARDEAQSGQLSPRWGRFEKYPQWVLIPLNIPYNPVMLVNGHYMIFNTVNLSYLYVDAQNNSIFMRPISADVTDQISFTQFDFVISKTGISGSLFYKKETVKVGLPDNIPFNFGRTNTAIYNQQMVDPPYNGNYDYYIWDEPFIEGQELSLIVSDTLPNPSTNEIIELEWVFKRLLIDFTRINRIIAYNDLPLTQENNGLYITTDPSPLNQNNNAPSMTSISNTGGVLFQFQSTTYVDDEYSGGGPRNRYIFIDENLKATSETIVQIISIISAPDSTAIGVFGNYPQPRMLDLNFEPLNNANYWSVSTLNKFSIPSNRVERSNYFYANTTYSFYSFNDDSKAGFLSSERFGGNPGWAPSTNAPRTIDSSIYGNANTIFTIV